MQKRFNEFFPDLNKTLQDAVLPLIERPEFEGIFSSADVAMLKAKTGLEEDALALALLPLAAAYAVVPVSHFHVGAIARGESGTWYFGGNMEFVGVPLSQTIHAEQCAIAHAWMSGEKRLHSITVNYSPCGHCRQFMTELNSGVALKISLPGRLIATLDDYLPYSFGPRDLGITTLLMDKESHSFVSEGYGNELIQAAISAANRSHAPYSASYSGAAFETSDGKIFSGSYAENAAYNPSLSPLQVAIALFYIKRDADVRIARAALAETSEPVVPQYNATRELLRALGCNELVKVLLPGG